MTLRIKLKDDMEIERDQMEVSERGVWVDNTLYPPEMIESIEEVKP